MRPPDTSGKRQKRRRLLTVVLNYDDIILLVALMRSYFGSEAVASYIQISGSRLYSWDDLDQFLEQCPRVGRIATVLIRVTTASKGIEIDFRRKCTYLHVTGPDAQGVSRCERRVVNFLMSTRPRLWPSYKAFFESPKSTAALAFILLTSGYVFDHNLILGTVLLATYIAGSVLWLNPTWIAFKDRDQLRAESANRTQQLIMTPLSVIGGVLGIISILGHLH